MNIKQIITTETGAVVLAALWGLAIFNHLAPASVSVDLSFMGLGPTAISPGWLVAYALVRGIKKTATNGEIPFTTAPAKVEG